MKQFETRADFMKDVKSTFLNSIDYKNNKQKIEKDSWLCKTSKGFPVITYPYNEDQFDIFMDVFNMLNTGYEKGIYLNHELNYILTRITGKFDYTATRDIIENSITVGLLNRGYDPYGENRKAVFNRCETIINYCLDESRKVKEVPTTAKVISFNKKRVS